MLRSHTLLHLLDLRRTTPETDISGPASPLQLLSLKLCPASAECATFLLCAAPAGFSATDDGSSALLCLTRVTPSAGSSRQAKEQASARPTMEPSQEWRGGSPLLALALKGASRPILVFRALVPPPDDDIPTRPH
jgi:hypothetical protein